MRRAVDLAIHASFTGVRSAILTSTSNVPPVGELNRMIVPNTHFACPIFKKKQFTCEVCSEEFSQFSYIICSICRILADAGCARAPRNLRIELHHHVLTLIYSIDQAKKQDSVFCKICGRKVNTDYGAYCCKKCNYFTHVKCGRKYGVEDGSWGSPTATADEFICEESLGNRILGELNLEDHVGPHYETIQHFSHNQHELILNDQKLQDDKRCEGCMQLITSIPFYSCVQCSFFLHSRCAEVPTQIFRCALHKHPLTLSPIIGTFFL